MLFDLQMKHGLEAIYSDVNCTVTNALCLVDTAAVTVGGEYSYFFRENYEGENQRIKSPFVGIFYAASRFGTDNVTIGIVHRSAKGTASGQPQWWSQDFSRDYLYNIDYKNSDSTLAVAWKLNEWRAGFNMQLVSYARSSSSVRVTTPADTTEVRSQKTTGLMPQIAVGYTNTFATFHLGYRPLMRLYRENTVLQPNRDPNHFGDPYDRGTQLFLGMSGTLGRVKLMYAHERDYQHQVNRTLNSRFTNAYGAQLSVRDFLQPYVILSQQSDAISILNPRSEDTAVSTLTVGTKFYTAGNFAFRAEYQTSSSDKSFMNENDENSFYRKDAALFKIGVGYEIDPSIGKMK